MIRFHSIIRFPLIAGMIMSLASLTPAWADSFINVKVSGEIVRVDPNLSGVFSIGERVDGAFLYRILPPQTDDRPADPTLGFYPSGLRSMHIQTSGGFLGTSPSGDVIIGNDSPFFADAFSIRAHSFQGISGDIADFSIISFGFDLLDLTESAFTDDSLPASLTLSDFNIRRGAIQFVNRTTGRSNLFTWEPQSIRFTTTDTIPEPSTMLLFGSGLAGLAAWRYKKARIQ